MEPATPLILLSGMGADERVFARQAEAFPQLIVPKWIEPRDDESIASYAARLARVVDPSRPCFVGGASFGGSVAMELARHVDARACFLIGSVRVPEELPLRVRALRRLARATRVMPFETICRLAGSSVEVVGFCSTPTTRKLLRQLSAADAAFLRWATRAVLTWRPDPAPLACPVYHIHGDRDRVLPVACARPDRVVAGAGHVLSMTHAAEVNNFLRAHVARHESALAVVL